MTCRNEHHGSSPGKAILTVKGVDFEYLSDPVLQDTTVGVARGEILAILGPNGVGKFTLLKCMNLTDPETKDRSNSSGRDGSNKDVRHRDCTKRGICCPQRNESARMTMFDTVLLGRKKPHLG
ncbi:MAG: ABC transporter ATP-binding protein [Methanocorpusculum sp.]|nr:ABC transporter ATP-binding protein [Methanocorpusculum sp.]